MKPALLVAIAIGLGIGWMAGAAAARDCSAPGELMQLRTTLPNTARAIRRGETLTIVAIGSSSTEGVGATSRANAYPAQLAAELGRRWPQLDITVINKGVGGEDAWQMVARFERDVLAYRPQLVIWQVGSNYALRHHDLNAYADTVRKGVRRLQAAGADVVLMDLQYAPKLLEKTLHRRILDTMGAIAQDTKIALFRRYAVMRHWVTSGKFGMDEIVARDRLHMNDTSYRCIGRLLAGSLTAAARASLASPAGGAAAARGGLTFAGSGLRKLSKQ